MTTDQIADQIETAARKHAAEMKARLPRHSVPTPAMADAIESQFQSAYLSGVMQLANFMTGNDGIEGINPTNVMAACSIAGRRMGFAEGPPTSKG